MPVFSYLAYPVAGSKQSLFNELSALNDCEVLLAEEEDVLILVTETTDENEEKELQNKLQKLASLQSLSMTFGHIDD
jgi:nitrate reductase NapAB chaperone NapD